MLDRWSVNEPDYTTLQPGSPHPKTRDYPGYVLLREMPIEPQNPNWVYRLWTNGYSAQDTYNYSIRYSGENNSYPIYVREYLELRSTYAPRTKLSSDGGTVYLVDVTAGGSGYIQGETDVTFTGVGGSGATALAIIDANGAVSQVIVLTEGSGYPPAATSVAIVSSGGTGSGATATVAIQSDTALLIHESVDRTGDDNDSLYVKVKRIYETLPGPAIVTSQNYEDETGALMRRYEQRVASGTSVKNLADEYPAASGYYVWQSKMSLTVEDGVVGTLVTDVMQKPADRTEYSRGNFPVPSVVAVGASPTWAIPPPAANVPPGPYQGITYTLETQSPASPLKLVHSYGIPGSAIPFSPASATDTTLACYAVTSQPSRFLPITNNTIHGGFTISASGFGNVEIVDASDPPNYVSGSHVIDVDQIQWHGPFMKRTVTTVVFP